MQSILMLTPYLPYPPVSGGRSRTYNLIKWLSRDYKITVVCFGRPEEKAFDLGPLQELCELIVIDRGRSPGALRVALLSLTSIRPVTMRIYASPRMRATVQRLLRVRLYDLIHIESFYMLQNLPHHLPVPILLSEPAIEYIAWRRHARVARPIFQRPVIWLEALKMRIFEPQTWLHATLVGVMSEVDAALVRRTAPAAPTALAPNGVDVDYFKPANIPRQMDNAVFMGDYKYFPNTDAVMYFMREIMPLIRAERPNFTLTLLGKDPPRALVELAKNSGAGLKVEGLVEDTRPYLNRATVFVCPLRSGSGTRFKLLEALACGCPVVSTSLGCEGLGARHDRHMLIADSPHDFATAVLRLLNQPDEAARIGRHGRNWVVERFSWSRSAALLSDAYQSLIGSEDLTVPSPINRRVRRR